MGVAKPLDLGLERSKPSDDESEEEEKEEGLDRETDRVFLDRKIFLGLMLVRSFIFWEEDREGKIIVKNVSRERNVEREIECGG